MYERSKQIDSFHIHGFQFWDGALVVASMKVGDALELRAEEAVFRERQARLRASM